MSQGDHRFNTCCFACRNVTGEQSDREEQARKTNERDWIKPFRAVQHVHASGEDQDRAQQSRDAQRSEHAEHHAEGHWPHPLAQHQPEHVGAGSAECHVDSDLLFALAY